MFTVGVGQCFGQNVSAVAATGRVQRLVAETEADDVDVAVGRQRVQE